MGEGSTNRQTSHERKIIERIIWLGFGVKHKIGRVFIRGQHALRKGDDSLTL